MKRQILLLLALLLIAGAAIYFGTRRPSGTGHSPQPGPSDAATLEPAGVDPADKNFNPGWIGAACRHDSECNYEGGFCLLNEEGFPRGYCSARCQKFCPDRKGDFYSVSFCIEDPSHGSQGICAARCNLHLTTSGCRPGYICTSVRRLAGEAVRLACLPMQGTPAPPTPCTRKLTSLGLAYARPDFADTPSRPARPGDPIPDQEVCQIDTPVLLSSPIHTVDYREKLQRHAEHLLVACKLALAIERLSEILAKMEVVEVQHNGTYNCRGVAGSSSLSGHGHAKAIDITGFELARSGPVSVEKHWHAKGSSESKFLLDLAARLRKAKIFDVILTPAGGSRHQDHLHLEVR